jgi:hypothetical protein
LFYCYYFENLSYLSNLSNLSKKLSKIIEFIVKLFFAKWTHSKKAAMLVRGDLNFVVEKNGDFFSIGQFKIFTQNVY